MLNNKGQIIEVFGLLIILGISIFGVSKIYYQKENLFVGYEGIYFKYSECKDIVSRLPTEKLVVFTSVEAIDHENYVGGDCHEIFTKVV